MRVALPLCVASLLLVGCLDWTTAEPGDAGSPAPVDRDAGADTEPDSETPSCPTRESVCEARCGEVMMQGCEPYACPPCDQDACTPVVTCASIQAQCGSLDTGCETVTCEEQCGGLPCVENLCCEPEEDAVACRGSCGGTVTNRCGQEVTCANPCGPESDGCRDSEPPVAAVCFCPHAWQGDTCEQTQVAMLEPADFASDPAGQLTYVIDAKQRSVLRIDRQTGIRTVLSDDDDDGVPRGAGPGFVRPARLALDLRSQRGFVSDLGTSAILEVDLRSGNRKLVSRGSGEGARGSGPALDTPKGMALDLERDRMLVVGGTHHVFEVDLSTGARRLFSSADFEGAAYGTGPRLDIPQDIALDLENQSAWVFGSSSLMQVDLRNGNRTLISTHDRYATEEGTLRGEGPKFSAVFSGAVDLASGRALVADLTLDAFFAIDLLTGNRSLISGDDGSGQSVGTGPIPEGLFAVELEARGTHLLALDSIGAAIFRVELATGNRTSLFDSGVGPGPGFQNPHRIALHAARDAAYVVDYDRKELLEVELATGARRSITGEGEVFVSPYDVVVDGIRREAYVLDSGVGVFRVALDTGARTVISREADHDREAGLVTGVNAVFDGPRSRLVATRSGSPSTLLSIDLATGQRTLLTSTTRGSGPALPSLSGLTLDGSRNLAFVVSSNTQAIYQVDLATGDRSIVSGRNPDGTVRGQGPLPNRAVGVGIDAAARVLYVADVGTALLRVDLTTGDRSVVSSFGSEGARRGRGIGLFHTEGIAIDVPGGFAHVVDSILRAIVRIDLASGDRALVSRVTF